MKKIIILLTIFGLIYNHKSYLARQPKKQGFIRVTNGGQLSNTNNSVNRNLNQMGNTKNNQIQTLPGFASMKLLDPNGLNQASKGSSTNNSVHSNVNSLYTDNNNNQNLNLIPSDNSNNMPHNHYTANSPVVPMTLANQMNTIYNQNKQNEIPHGSAYESYQAQQNSHVGLPVNNTQMPVPYQASSQIQQSSIPMNNQNQVNTSISGNYFNNQNMHNNSIYNK